MKMIIWSLRRVLQKYVSAYYVSLRNCSQKFVELSSDLYIPHQYRNMVFSSLDPYIDIDNYFKNITKLKSDLKNRKINVDVDDLYLQSVSYKALSLLINKLTKDIIVIKSELKKLSSVVEQDSDVVKKTAALESKLCEIQNKLAQEWDKFYDLEKSFIIPFLQLPNNLHKNTTEQDEILFSLFPKPKFSFPAKSHVVIGTSKGELYFRDVSPSSYYMKGRLAVLELALGDYILSRFKELGFRNYSNLNSVKATVAAGCGINTKADDQNFKINDYNYFSSNHTRILMGSASVASFMVLLCQGLLRFKSLDLPVRFVSLGQKYQISPNPDTNSEGEKSLFAAIQSSCASGLVAYSVDMNEEVVVNEVAMMLTQIYTELGLHFILIQYGAHNLKAYESLAIGVCMYSPHSKTYIEVGRISLCQEYISKRLQIYQVLDKKKAAFLGMIFVEILDVKNWIGCLMENTQTYEGDFVIPQCLESHMLK